MSAIEETYATCQKAGGMFPQGSPPEVGPRGEIASRPWGETFFSVVDPFGNEICFVDEDTVFTG